MKNIDNYFLGLDIGTSSVGWAVTDEEYRVPKFNGKKMWGVRLFNEAETAEARRLQRGARRRLDRKKERINLLQEFFAEEISRKDPNFFIRLNNSDLYPEDKDGRLGSKYSLFNDKDFKDRDYHRKYPTIHHLIMDLINNKDKKDIRLVYLACHYLLKNRGHFIFEGQEFSSASSFENSLSDLRLYLDREYEEEDFKFNTDDVVRILTSKDLSKKEKIDKLKPVFGSSDLGKGISNILVRGKQKLESMFKGDWDQESEIKEIDFSKTDFEDRYAEYENALGERIDLINILKTIYDTSIINEFLLEASPSPDGKKYISSAFVYKYDKHGQDLKKLKALIKKYLKAEYNNIFRRKDVENNYVAYTRSSISSGQRVKADKYKYTGNIKIKFYDFLKKKLALIDDLTAKDEVDYILAEIKANTFLPKQKSSENGVIPYQLKEVQLSKILDNQKEHYTFLNKEDNYGTVADKIRSIMTFRIPYYVGPINQHSQHAWIKKLSDDKVTPWNYKDVIDLEGSRNEFIDRLIGRCSFLKNERVLPKSSLLYTEYMVLNELNNLKINSQAISPDFKKKIIEEIFKKQKKVTLKKVKALYMEEYNDKSDLVFTGTDGDFKQGLVAYNDFRKIIGDKIKEEAYQKYIEEIIKDIVLYSDDKKNLRSKLSKKYSQNFSPEEIKAMSNLKYKDWGRLSEKLLIGVEACDTETGEMGNIMHFMREYNFNLMELMSQRFTFAEEIKKLNPQDDRELSFEIVDELYLSPAVKRMLWQSLKIVDEIRGIMKKDPKKIFIEMTRSKGVKNQRTLSRKDSLINFYKACKNEFIEAQKYFKDKIDYDEIFEGLKNTSESTLRITNLYLYYTQMGRCMYSLEPIDISQIKNQNLYDQDHIFPKSKLYDDSIENRVLVKKTLNSEKGNNYPIPEKVLNKNVYAFWKMLKDRGLIGAKKYSRLIRRTPFTDEEQSGFIARQIVETGQATKEAARTLKDLCQDSEIVYSKAENISRFRHKYNIVKCRSVNDLHHAHDAYLNIVVGNVYNTKFTKNPRNFIKDQRAQAYDKDKNEGYNLEKLFEYDVKRGNATAWIGCKDNKPTDKSSIVQVKKELGGGNFRFTRLSYIGKGELFNATLQRKGSGTLPLKGKGPRSDIKKYGGFTKVNRAYFTLVDIEEDTKKGSKITRKLLPVSRECYYRQAKNPDQSKEILADYLRSSLGIESFKIVYPQVKMHSMLKIDGAYYTLSGGADNRIEVKNAIQPLLPNEVYALIRQLEKESDNKFERIEGNKAITEEALNKTFDLIMDKFESSIYSKSRILNLKAEGTSQFKEAFKGLDLKQKCENLLKLIVAMSCTSNQNKSKVKMTSTFRRIRIPENLKGYNEFKLINQSITGLFENEVDLLSL